jgi:putative transposase
LAIRGFVQQSPIHDPIANLFHLPRHEMTSEDFRELRTAAMNAWRDIAQLGAA